MAGFSFCSLSIWLYHPFPDKALDHLEIALDHYQPTWDYMMITISDFKNISDSDRFKELMNKHYPDHYKDE